jgi:chorismate mutase
MDDDSQLAPLRAAMDAINQQLVATLHQRARLCRQIGRWKHAHGVPAADPAREAAMRTALLADLPPDGFTRDQLAAILDVVFAASRQLVTTS